MSVIQRVKIFFDKVPRTNRDNHKINAMQLPEVTYLVVVVIKTLCLIRRCSTTDAGAFKNRRTPASFWKPLKKMSLSQFLSKAQKGSSDRKSRFCLCRILEKDHDMKNGNGHGWFKNHRFMERCGLTDVCVLVVNVALDRNIKLPYMKPRDI